MRTIENRLEELEFRIQKLEEEIRLLRNEEKTEFAKSSSNLFVELENLPNKTAAEAYSAETIPFQEGELGKYEALDKTPVESFSSPKEAQEQPSPKKNKDRESLVGKYFIGALASLLIFIAAASFIAIVWNRISPQIKLAIVSIAGLALSALGFKMTLKKASNISSIIFGTGIGLVYIALASASLIFSLISHEASASLCVLWTIMILFSHRYTKLYFTMVIASIGSFINLCLELAYIESSRDILLVIVYTGIVMIMLLYMSNSLDKIRNVISIFFAFFNFVLIFGSTFGFWDSPYPMAQTLATLIMLLITNWMYRLANREDIRYTYFLLSFFSTLFLFANIDFSFSDSKWLNLSSLQCSILFFALILAQFILNHILYPKIENLLSMFYTLVLYLAMLIINNILLDLWLMGAAPIILLFVLRKKLLKKSIPLLYLMLFIFLDLLFSYDQNNVWTLIFNIANLLLLFYILYEEKTENLLYKNAALAVLLLAYFKISYNICNLTHWNTHIYDIENFLAYVMSVCTVMIAYKCKYLSHKGEGQPHSLQHSGLYFLSIVLYFFGMREIFRVDPVLLRFIIMLASLSLALFQSRLLLSDYEKIPDLIGIWFVLKYFIFTWVMLRAFWELPFDSVVYSVAGLLLAVAAIYAGFQLKIKITRQFGLAITMLMVAKFIFVDLQGENSITRVLSFAAGGVLCFIISIIYNRLSKE